jgi:hypothetical protein
VEHGFCDINRIRGDPDRAPVRGRRFFEKLLRVWEASKKD